MTTIDFSWKSVQIKFQTAGMMPPPYAYFYTMVLHPQKEELSVDLTLHYLDRDELDEESILDEGFTLDDDYAWKGTLPHVWLRELQMLLSTSVMDSEQHYTDQDNYLEIVLEEKSGNTVSVFPENQDRWNYFQQELLQAIYEVSDKENPFLADYLEIDGRNRLQVKLMASFENRTLHIRINDAEPHTLPWEQTQEIMEVLFRADFVAEYALEKEPTQNGLYLTIGDGLWYTFGEALVEPGPKSKALPGIVRLFDTLREKIVG